jgi:hypothetical protein
MLPFHFPLRHPRIESPEGFDRLTLRGPIAGARGIARAPIVLSRALYRVRLFDLSAVRPVERLQALRLQLAAWSPFENAEYLVGMHGSEALVFGWDQEPIARSLGAQGWAAGGRQLCPETLLRVPVSSGLRVQACLDGWEGQVWKGGLLMHSQWWPVRPDEGDWRSFLRTRVAQEWRDQAAPSQPVPWTSRPWLSCRSPDELDLRSKGPERTIGWAVVCGLAIAAGFQFHGLTRAYAAWSSAQDERDALKQQAAAGLELRAKALDLASRANMVGQALRGVEPLEVMAQLAAALPDKGVTVQQLTVDPSQVRVVLQLAADLPRSVIVRQIQAGGYFLDVRESRDVLPAGAVAFEFRLPFGRSSDGGSEPSSMASGPGGSR